MRASVVADEGSRSRMVCGIARFAVAIEAFHPCGRNGSRAERTGSRIREMGDRNKSGGHFSIFREPARFSEMHVRFASQSCEFVALRRTYFSVGEEQSRS